MSGTNTPPTMHTINPSVTQADESIAFQVTGGIFRTHLIRVTQ